MQLTNEFHVAADPATTWAVLTDLERIAPCMPGAQLQEVAGDEFRGVVKVKVGPITAQYKGTARFVEQDAGARRAVVTATGRDTRGQGNASATVTATLTPDGDGTHVSVSTELTVTGKVAQFGRGVMADVSARLLGQFAESLESTVLRAPMAGAGAPAGSEVAGEPEEPAESAGGGAAGQPVVRRINGAPVEPVDMLGAAGSPLAKRLGPLLLIVAILVVLRSLARRRHG
jgi:uncharacterized protein